jgi:hypothetical protein
VLLSNSIDSFSGNVQVSRDFWATSLSGDVGVVLAVRSSNTLNGTGYYAHVDLGASGPAAILYKFNSGTYASIDPAVASAPTFAVNHLYRLILQVTGSDSAGNPVASDVMLSVRTYLADLTAGTWLSRANTWIGQQVPFAYTVDDAVSIGYFGGTPIEGAGYVLFVNYGNKAIDEAYSVVTCPQPGLQAYTQVLPDEFRFDVAGKPLQLHNPGGLYDSASGLYWMVGVDASQGTSFSPRTDGMAIPCTIRLYSSPDLMNWTPRGTAISSLTINSVTYVYLLYPRILKHPTNGYYYQPFQHAKMADFPRFLAF